MASLSLESLHKSGLLPSITVAGVFCGLLVAIWLMRQDVIPYRPGQAVRYDIVARVDFAFHDRDRLLEKQRQARELSPHVYKSNGDVWAQLRETLLDLPAQAAGDPALLPEPLKKVLDSGAITALRQQSSTDARRAAYVEAVDSFVKSLSNTKVPTSKIIILPVDQYRAEVAGDRLIRVEPDGVIKSTKTYHKELDDFRLVVETAVRNHFLGMQALQPRLTEVTLAYLEPTHVLDEVATTEAQNKAAADVPSNAGLKHYKANQVLVDKDVKSTFDEQDWMLLKAENQAYRTLLGEDRIKSFVGLAITAVLLTITLSLYVSHFQKRLLRNRARAIAVVVLLASMLLLAQLAAISSVPLYLLDSASTVMVAMILAIAYDKRFAIGVGATYAVLVTVALDQSIGYFIIQWVGVMTAAMLLDDVRNRSKLIEVCGVCALAMMVALFADGLIRLEPIRNILQNCLYVGLAAIAAGFVTLGILPFIEKAFRITTSMTLLEIADASQPLLRRLALEAPGTYNHSLQVATLSESAAEAIHGNSLLCRVASYYHDVGKINKAEYFIENQSGGANRHINLTPSVSLLIIKGHVKDGIELAKEYNLPTSLHAFIQQHHGTTLVEFFYHRARTAEQADDTAVVSEEQYRYDGPKPRSKEVAIVMLADCVESACRAMPEPNPARVESLVHDLAMKRLLDGQFDECDLTIRELAQIEKAMVKTLLGIYHGRIAYPSMSDLHPAISKTA